MTSADDFESELADLERAGLLRTERTIGPRRGPVVEIDGREVVLFCSNDYLGLSEAPALVQAAHRAFEAHGVGSGASRLISGTRPPHLEAEARLAAWVGQPAALLFSTGYAANLGALSAVLGRGDVAFSDRLNHASLIDGLRLSRADVHVFRHADTDHLQQLLEAHRGAGRRAWIVTETVFSMDGDLAPLDSLRALADRFDAGLFLDEAHALGVLGAGRGAAHERGVSAEAVVGTLGKAAGVSGAFVAGSFALRSLLRNRARSYIYSTAPPAALAELAGVAVDLAAGADERRLHLAQLSTRLRDGLRAQGWRVPEGVTPIIPIHVDDPVRTMALSARLLELGFFVQGIRPPTVPKGTSRLRLVPTAAHTHEQVEALLDAFSSLRETAAHRPPAPRRPAPRRPASRPLASDASEPQPPTASAVAARSDVRRLFISGTGTGVGKTVLTCALARALSAAGHAVSAVKPIETGCEPSDDGLLQDAAPMDALLLARACGRPELASAPGLVRAVPPLSPRGATLEGEAAVVWPELVAATRAAMGPGSALVEGAGGVLVPIDRTHTMVDLARALGLDVVLVARDGLGVLSHVLTAALALRVAGLRLVAVVLSQHGEADPSRRTNRAVLTEQLECPVLDMPEHAPEDGARVGAELLRRF